MILQYNREILCYKKNNGKKNKKIPDINISKKNIKYYKFKETISS